MPQPRPVVENAVESKETPAVEVPSNPEEVEEPVSAPVKPERVLLLTPGGPLVVDVFLSIAGRGHEELLQEQIHRVLAAGDTDDDGKSTWSEWQENEEFFEDELSDYNQRQAKAWVKRYDQNYDKKMQPAEAASWLGRDRGGSARAFSVRSRKSYAGSLVSASRVWQLLDLDRDDRLSEEEILGSPNRFWQLDANDDRTITSREFATLEEQLEAAGGRRFRSNYVLNRSTAIHLDSTFEADRLDSLLSDIYASRQNLRKGCFSDLPGLFATLDLDRNERLDGDELSDLSHVEPMAKISISFFELEEGRKSAKMRIDGLDEGLLLLTQSSDDRAVISLGKTRLFISAHDLVVGEADGSALQGSQIRLMVHDQGDSLFREIDSNDDGRLGEREISSCAERIKQHDADRDGQLTVDEFPYSMIVAFLRGEEASERSFYSPDPTAVNSHAEGTPRWFEQADFNADGDLSRREFLGSSERFDGLDLNRDGYIDSEEAATFEAD